MLILVNDILLCGARTIEAYHAHHAYSHDLAFDIMDKFKHNHTNVMTA